MTTAEHRNPGPEIRWDEYDHFAGFGWDNDRIAERRKVHPNSLKIALTRRAARQAPGRATTGGQA